MSAAVTEPVLLTVDQVADMLAITRRHVYTLFDRGELQRVHLGRCARVRRADVLRLAGLEDPDGLS